MFLPANFLESNIIEFKIVFESCDFIMSSCLLLIICLVWDIIISDITVFTFLTSHAAIFQELMIFS